MRRDTTRSAADVVRGAFEAFVAGGMRAGAEAGYAENVVFVDLPEFPDGGEHHGREAAIRHIERFFDAMQDGTIELIDDAGDLHGTIVFVALGAAVGRRRAPPHCPRRAQGRRHLLEEDREQEERDAMREEREDGGGRHAADPFFSARRHAASD